MPLERCLGDDIELCADDLPGHGTRRAEPFDLGAALAELTASVATAAAHRPVILAGDSLGGYLALAVAARLGTALRGVVAGSCTYPMRGVAGLAARASLLGGALVPARAIEGVLRRACAPDIGDAIVLRGLAPAMRGKTLRALLGRDVRADVAAIRVPIVFIDGALDIPIAWFAGAFARIGNDARATLVPGALHGVGLTHPDVFARAIRELAETAPEGDLRTAR